MLIKEKTSLDQFGDFVKIAVDVRRKVIAADCELHIDCMEELMHDGSLPKDIWGANAYPADKKMDFISLINVRPADGNRSMDITLAEIRREVESVVKELLFS